MFPYFSFICIAYHKMKTCISETEGLTRIRDAYEEMPLVAVLFLITSRRLANVTFQQCKWWIYAWKAIDEKLVHLTVMSLLYDFLCTLLFKWQNDKWLFAIFSYSIFNARRTNISQSSLWEANSSFLLFLQQRTCLKYLWDTYSNTNTPRLMRGLKSIMDIWDKSTSTVYFFTICSSLLKALPTFSIILSLFSVSIERSILRTWFFPWASNYVTGRMQRDMLGCFSFADLC